MARINNVTYDPAAWRQFQNLQQDSYNHKLNIVKCCNISEHNLNRNFSNNASNSIKSAKNFYSYANSLKKMKRNYSSYF